MALTERSRHKLYESFSVIIDDDQAVEEMLSYFPARDTEEPVTKDFLRAELGEMRTEMHRMARTTQAWIVTTGISMAGLMLAIARFG